MGGLLFIGLHTVAGKDFRLYVSSVTFFFCPKTSLPLTLDLKVLKACGFGSFG